jgi:homoserine dehydrogenase
MTSVAEIGRQQHETWDAPATTVVRVALAGCGAVGSALLREIVSRRDALAERHGIEIVLTSVLVRDVARRRDATFDASLLTNSVDEFLAAPADVVIEAIGGFDPALRIAQTVLGRGQSLITANKLLLASHGSSLASLARRNGTTLRYDAAVGGGVPVLRVLDDALAAGGVSRVRGILNGTANFVLTRLEEGESLDGALGAARDAGFAEADASRDLDGRDAADKIALIAWAAFGVAPEALPVRRTSLLPDPARYVSLAQRIGASVRHVAECEQGVDGVVASVEPVLVATASSLGRTRDEGNHVDVFAGWRSPLCASGPGAGGVPTATALLSDLVCTGVAPRRHERTRIAARDTRTFAWALEVCAEPTVLHRHVPNCGLVRTTADATASWTIVDDATSDDVAIIVEQLTLCGASPIVARVDSASVTSTECWS